MDMGGRVHFFFSVWSSSTSALSWHSFIPAIRLILEKNSTMYIIKKVTSHPLDPRENDTVHYKESKASHSLDARKTNTIVRIVKPTDRLEQQTQNKICLSLDSRKTKITYTMYSKTLVFC